MEGVGPPLVDTVEGGHRSEDAGEILCHVHSVVTALWVGYLVCDPSHGADPGGGVPPPGGVENHGEAPKAMAIWRMGIPFNKVGSRLSGDQVVGSVHQK